MWNNVTLVNPITGEIDLRQAEVQLNRRIRQALNNINLADIIFGLTADRLVYGTATGGLSSVASLTSWIAGTTNQITVTDDGDGTATLSLPQNIHAAASPTFAGLTLSGLTASRLISTNGSSVLASSDLFSWIAGTSNQITVTDDADGTVTLSLPQDIHSAASPTFADLTLSNLTASRLVSTDGSSKMASVADLTSWIAGTSNQITVTNDADGTITLSTPQDIATSSNVTFANITGTGLIKGATGQFGNVAGGNYSNFDSDGDISFVGTARIDWAKITANSITLTTGTSTDALSDLQTAHDGNFYSITEATGAPGSDLITDFVSVTSFNWVNIYATYEGAATHALAVQLYNWTQTRWDTFGCIQNAHANITTAGGYILCNHDFIVPNDAEYIGTGGDAGKVRVRLYHTASGNASHDLHIDVISLYK